MSYGHWSLYGAPLSFRNAKVGLALPSQDEAGFLPNTSINVGLNAIVN